MSQLSSLPPSPFLDVKIMQSNFYPHILRSYWYTGDVCYSILRSLEGLRNWYTPLIHNDCERQAYREVFDECLAICIKNDISPDNMVQGLNALKENLKTRKKPFILSRNRWLYNVDGMKEEAVCQALQLVEGIATRYLP